MPYWTSIVAFNTLGWLGYALHKGAIWEWLNLMPKLDLISWQLSKAWEKMPAWRGGTTWRWWRDENNICHQTHLYLGLSRYYRHSIILPCPLRKYHTPYKIQNSEWFFDEDHLDTILAYFSMMKEEKQVLFYCALAPIPSNSNFSEQSSRTGRRGREVWSPL